ncbi:MAG: hypothetical protein GXO69_10215 [Acidobacteria bacterium]|nr:hypothetical protein [Acidobacteriota bacterium]
MVVLLVILTFAVLFAAGMMVERREKRERSAARELHRLAQQAVFAQDGGEPLKKETEDSPEKNS